MSKTLTDKDPEFDSLVPLTYTVAEVAVLAGVSHAQVYDWVALNKLKRAVPMRHIRMSRVAVHRFLEGGGV